MVFYLQSLPNADFLLSPKVKIFHVELVELQIKHHSFTQGEIQLEEVYRGMMITAAHLHLMIRDAYDSARFCPSENHAQHQNIRQ